MSALASPQSATVSPRPVNGVVRHSWTREEYFRLAALGAFQGMRVERIYGEIVDMSPVGWPHQLAKTLVGDTLRTIFAQGHWIGEQGPFTAEDSDPEPDVAVYVGHPRDYKDHPTVAVLVVEVADSSLTYDTTTKVELYASEHIPEYWVLDLVNRRLLVHRDPITLPVGGATYRTQITFQPTDTVSPLVAPTASVRVADLLP